jgi:hypothetical protein
MTINLTSSITILCKGYYTVFELSIGPLGIYVSLVIEFEAIVKQ